MLLAVFAVLLEAFLAIGDVTIFVAFPEFFLPALFISLLFIFKDKLKPIAFKLIIHNRFALTVVLFRFQPFCICIFLNGYSHFKTSE